MILIFELGIERQIINLGEDIHSKIESRAIGFLDGMLISNTNYLIDEDTAVDFIHYLCVQYFRTKTLRKMLKSCF